MITRLRFGWMGVLLLAALALLVTPVAAQTTPTAAPTTLSFPLAEPGPYTVGFQVKHLADTSRDGRALEVWVWYPAIAPEHPTDQQSTVARSFGWRNATPDPQAAPYPLILFSPGDMGTNLPQVEMPLASHGFVVAGLQSHPNDDTQNSFVDRPLDLLFVLDQLTAANPNDFARVIDTAHVGVMGASFGAYTSLALTGARFDAALGSALEATPFVSTAPADSDPRKRYSDWNWANLSAYRATFSAPQTGDALWPPFSDPRIQAALMFSPCWVSLFGERGLAEATVPSLIVGGTSDKVCPYEPDDLFTYAHLGSTDRYLLSIIGGGNIAGLGKPVVTQLYTAFFGEYLQGNLDYSQYLTADYVNRVEAQLKLGLLWGPYTGS